ncbi:MAG: isochorismatase family protein [Phycisphaerales bacterium]|nr:isochorismatase family protein [Phycisphaerales bacterium]
MNTGRNVYLERLTPDNCAMLLIDHQTGTMLGVQDIRLDQFKSNVLALAKTAKANRLPTVLTASYPEGPNGPLMPELLAMFPSSEVINRPGPISAFDDPRFVEAVKRTGRKKLIMAGVTSDVCLMFPVQQALALGYEVYAVYDASGCWDTVSEMVSILRLSQMGAVVCNWVAVCADLQADWRNAPERTLPIFAEHLPFYGMLANNQSFTRVQAGTKSS